ncbi:hypothetical protein RJT34_24338 [Clitoria ternatea]|uniref:Uncharacterized protein n=1 Tax=Clitoria ternatea TaxID=43366 RepID=A0AAN9FQH3_CLITE
MESRFEYKHSGKWQCHRYQAVLKCLKLGACEYHHHNHGFGKLSMGNEMGNNNTSAIKEEDNTSEAEKKTFQEDTSDFSNGISQDIHADSVQDENQNVATSIAQDDVEKNSKASNDITIELGNDTCQEDGHSENVKGKAQNEDTEEETITTSMLENESLEGVTHASDVKMENQMLPKAEAEDTTTELGEVTLQQDSHADDVKEKIQMIPKGDACESNMSMENQMQPIAENEDVQEKATEMAFDDSRSLLENGLLKGNAHEDDANVDHQKHETDEGKDDQTEAILDFDDKTSEFEDKKDGHAVNHNAYDTDVQGKTTILASEDTMILTKCFEGAGGGVTEVRKPEKSPNSGPVEVVSKMSLSSFSMEGPEEYEKREDPCLRKEILSVTYDHHLNDETSIKQDEEETRVLTLNDVNMSHDSVLQGWSSACSNHDEPVKLSVPSFLEDNLLDTNSHYQQVKDDVFEEEMEFHERLLCTDESDGNNGNEFVSIMVDTSETSSDSTSIANNTNGNPITKVLHEESKLSINGSRENSHYYKPDQCMKGSLKEYTSSMVNAYDITIGSNGDANEETTIVLESSVSEIANNAQVEESKATKNGFQPEASLNKASDEELEASIAMVKNCEVTEMSEQCYSNVVTTNQEELFPMQSSCSLLHIYDYHQDNVKQNKSFTATSMPNSDWKQTNENKISGITIDNLHSSKLSSPSMDSVDHEAFEKELKEGEDYSQQTEADTISIEPCSNNSTFANGGYESRDSVTRLSAESNSDNPNLSCQMQKSPSFNLNLRMEARPEESDQTPLLHQDESANESLSKINTSLNLISPMPHPHEEMPVEEKIVMMERSYSKKCKAPFIGLLKEEEEAHLLVMPQTHDNLAGATKEVSSTSPKGKEKRKPRSSFFSSCMCCTTVAN